MKICDRCRHRTLSFRMSRFNTNEICPTCEEIERAHPRYPEAERVELEHVKAGDFNFPGIGLPADLDQRDPSTVHDETAQYCTVCRECVTCNLRPCRDGGPHRT